MEVIAFVVFTSRQGRVREQGLVVMGSKGLFLMSDPDNQSLGCRGGQ